jgi:hypothetical protein
MENQALTTRFIGDSDLFISVVLVKRTEKTAFVKIEKGEVVRCKIHKYNGTEFIMPYGRYSMAPQFNLN